MQQNLVILTGAGMSAESGLSTFRDQNGLWNKYRIEDVCTPEAWERNPQLILSFYNQLRHELLKAKPNKGHELIADLEKQFNVTVITQNVDNLHERAGSKKVIHLHGELMKVRSSKNPNLIYDVTPNHLDTHLGDLCELGSQLRPHIVWFGEAVPKIEEAAAVVSKADILLIIGTSLNVYPAAGLIHYVRAGVPIYLIDPAEVNNPTHQKFIHIKDKASVGMEKFCELIKEGKIPTKV